MKDIKMSRRTALAGASSRLRLLQAELADLSDSARQQAIDNELTQVLESVLPQDRSAFLEELRTFFPSWRDAGEPGPAAETPELDANALTEKLAQISSTLSNDKKLQIGRYLAKFGFSAPVPAAAAVPQTASASLKETLALTGPDAVDISRALEAMALLVQFTSDLDEVAWQTWKQIAPPNSTIRRELDLKRGMTAFLTNDPSGSKAKLSKGLEALRRLIAAFTTSIPVAGKAAAAELRKIAPDKVEEAVNAEGSRVFSAIEKRCWQKYKDLSETSKNSVETLVRKSIAQEVEKWMKTDQ